MNDILKKYQNQIAIGLLLIICPQVANHAYYNQLNVSYELYRPFDILSNIFYTYSFLEVFTDFFLIATIIWLLYKSTSFWISIIIKPYKGLNLFGSHPKLSTVLFYFKNNKRFHYHLKAKGIPEWFIYYRLLVNKEVLIFIVFWVTLKFLSADSQDSNTIVLRLSLIAYNIYFSVKYIFPLIFGNKRFWTSSLNLVIPIFIIIFFHTLGKVAGNELASASYEENYIPLSFIHSRDTIKTDSSFTTIMNIKNLLILRKHPVDSNYYFKKEDITHLVTGNPISKENQSHP